MINCESFIRSDHLADCNYDKAKTQFSFGGFIQSDAFSVRGGGGGGGPALFVIVQCNILSKQ